MRLFLLEIIFRLSKIYCKSYGVVARYDTTGLCHSNFCILTS